MVEGAPSNTAGGKKAQDPPLNQNALTFYWVNPGAVGNTVSYTYALDNGQSATATTTFDILGPTGNPLPGVTALPNGQGVRVAAGPKVQSRRWNCYGGWCRNYAVHGAASIRQTQERQCLVFEKREI